MHILHHDCHHYCCHASVFRDRVISQNVSLQPKSQHTNTINVKLKQECQSVSRDISRGINLLLLHCVSA